MLRLLIENIYPSKFRFVGTLMIVELKDVCEKEISNIRQKDLLDKKGDYPIYGASGLIGNVDFYRQETPYVAVVKDGAGIGRAMLLPAKSSVIGTMQYLIPKGNVLPEYLYYVVKNMHLEKYYSGATIPHIYFKYYKKEKFNLVDLDQQRKIISVFKKIEDAIRKQRDELTNLDTLIKARFVEMFGDPICNSKNKSTTKFINVVKLQRGFDLPIRKRNTQGKIPVYGSNGVLGYHDEFKASSGIITGRSGTIGKVYYENNEFWPLNTALFSVKTYGNNIIYLKYLVSLFKLERFCNGAGVPTLNRNDVHKQKIIDIPIKEQNKFASFVQQVDKSKVAIQKSLDETQILYDSLMQKYFS